MAERTEDEYACIPFVKRKLRIASLFQNRKKTGTILLSPQLEENRLSSLLFSLLPTMSLLLISFLSVSFSFLTLDGITYTFQVSYYSEPRQKLETCKLCWLAELRNSDRLFIHERMYDACSMIIIIIIMIMVIIMILNIFQDRRNW